MRAIVKIIVYANAEINNVNADIEDDLTDRVTAALEGSSNIEIERVEFEYDE